MNDDLENMCSREGLRVGRPAKRASVECSNTSRVNLALDFTQRTPVQIDQVICLARRSEGCAMDRIEIAAGEFAHIHGDGVQA